MGGGGRAGTVYAALLIHRGEDAEQVIRRVEGVEKDVQHAFLRGFQAGLRG